MAITYEAELPAVYLDAVTLAAVLSLRIQVYSRNPEPDEIGAPKQGTITFFVADTDLGGAGIDLARTTITIAGVLAFDGVSFLAPFNGALSAHTAIPGANGFKFVFDPTVVFESEQLVDVSLTTAIVSDVTEVTYDWQFTIEDYGPPRLVSAKAVGEKVVEVLFDEGMSLASLEAATWTFTPLDLPAVTPLVVAVTRLFDTKYRLTLDTEMSPRLYRLVVDGAEDSDGNLSVAPLNRADLQGWMCPRPPGRAFDLFKFIPKKKQREDRLGTGDARKFILCLQEVADLLLCKIDRFTDIFDVDVADEQFLDQLLYGLGNPFRFELTVLEKRKLARVLVDMYRSTGTAVGIEDAIRFFMGLEVTVTNALPYLGEGLGFMELGGIGILEPGTFSLGTDETRLLYSFDINTVVALTDEQRTRMRAIAQYMKLARCHLRSIIEPSVPVVPYDPVELGLSGLGVDFILH